MNLVKIGGLAAIILAVGAAIALNMRSDDPAQTLVSPVEGAAKVDAREAPSGATKAALTAAVDAFGAAMRERDFDTIIGTIPPAVMSSLAAKLGMADDAIGPAMRGQMEASLGVIEIVEFELDTANAELKEIDGGLTYAVLDTQTVMKTGGKTIKANTPTLALFVEDKWHLMRIDSDTQRAIVFEVYPDLKDVTLPESSMTVVEG